MLFFKVVVIKLVWWYLVEKFYGRVDVYRLISGESYCRIQTKKKREGELYSVTRKISFVDGFWFRIAAFVPGHPLDRSLAK